MLFEGCITQPQYTSFFLHPALCSSPFSSSFAMFTFQSTQPIFTLIPAHCARVEVTNFQKINPPMQRIHPSS